ncbi:MAG: hypothetical protein WBG30_02730 [Psychrilyobacter sp.]|uniref:hypothetical protein n=1 Tax=Psychrilyobacter sp. TaxID=2586924 RepID=UPI003C768E9B
MKTVPEKKLMLSAKISRTQKTYEKKEAYLKEIADDRATLEFLNERETAGEPMPSYSNYSNYTEWKDTVKKEIERAETTISNLENRMIEVEAFQYYVDTYTKTGE